MQICQNTLSHIFVLRGEIKGTMDNFMQYFTYVVYCKIDHFPSIEYINHI